MNWAASDGKQVFPNANARVPEEEDKAAASSVVSAKSPSSKSSLEQIDDAFPEISSAELENKFNSPIMNSKAAVETVESSQIVVTTTPSPKTSTENVDEELPELSSAELEGSSSSSSSTSAPTTTVMPGKNSHVEVRRHLLLLEKHVTFSMK